MNIQLKDLKKNYLRKLFSTIIGDRIPSNLILYASYSLDDIRDIVFEIKDEYNIKNIIFFDYDYEKTKSFFNSNPTNDEIERFVPKYLVPNGPTRIIYFNNVTDVCDNRFDEVGEKYYDYLEKKNKDFYKYLIEEKKYNRTVTLCPNKEWAKALYGNEDKLYDLWLLANEIIPTSEKIKEEVKERAERKRLLQEMNIHNLYFYNKLGTDFKLSLTKHSLWTMEPGYIDGVFNHYNFPSYEIYTSPNCYSAEGKIVLSKERGFYYDIIVKEGEFTFSKGKLIKCQTNDESFDKILFNKKNRLFRLGEIALVSQESPLAKQNMYFNSVILDENSGCHFAFGNSIKECIDIDDEVLKKKGFSYYRYNHSMYHEDFVFGDDSIMVEAETSNKKKILLMENGKWKI